VHTRVASLTLPALLGVILSLISGREDWIVLIGVLLLLGVSLDAGLYSWLISYQPPWMTFVLALGEFGLLYVLAQLLKLDLTPLEAIVFYWVSWVLAAMTKIVVLPILSLTYLESATEFRRTQWSIPASQAPLPASGAVAQGDLAPGPVLKEASGVHAIPQERRPALSGAHAIPSELAGPRS
jgi:hypothetical protein